MAQNILLHPLRAPIKFDGGSGPTSSTPEGQSDLYLFLPSYLLIGSSAPEVALGRINTEGYMESLGRGYVSRTECGYRVLTEDEHDAEELRMQMQLRKGFRDSARRESGKGWRGS